MTAVEHQLRERAGLLEEEPYRRGYRMRILQHAVEPLKHLLGLRGTERLIMALAMVYGIEPLLIWKDIFSASDRKVEAVARAGWRRSLRDDPCDLHAGSAWTINKFWGMLVRDRMH